MRYGVVPHSSYITEANVALLAEYDFVFVCVDKGAARRLICSHLIEARIPFIDCGMDMSMSRDQRIFGTCRVTLATPERSDQFFERAPTMDEAGDGLYEQNIQLADANALNAVLAVMRFKQHFGFYATTKDWSHLEFVVDTLVLAKA